MKRALINSIDRRKYNEISPRNAIHFIKEVSTSTYIDNLISTVYLYTHPDKDKPAPYVGELVATIGRSVQGLLKRPRNSSVSAKLGGFLLYSFEEIGIIEIVKGRGANGHNAYIVHVTNEEALNELWGAVEIEKTEKLPSKTPYAPWTSSRHASGMRLVKTEANEVLASLKPETHPIVFECVNRAQAVGWRINRAVYDVQRWALRNRAAAFNDIWLAHSAEAKATKLRETTTINHIAARYLEDTFYHLYYLDFRGRKYPATSYLHEQGSDTARGLLIRSDEKSIGRDGFFWLMVSLASNWAGDAGRDDGTKTDKLPLKDRFDWALDNEEILLSYASSPKVNQGWMAADKPWQFLAGCIELEKLRAWQFVNKTSSYDYESGLECYIDGSTNGSQHLAALTRDEVTAPHVNLVPSALPGDLYSLVADHVWVRINSMLAEHPEDKIKAAEEAISALQAAKKEYNRDELIRIKDEYKDVMDLTSVVFWSKITDRKSQRKIVKRNVMTIPYGGTQYGLGQQIIDDSNKHGIADIMNMEWKWGAYLGRVVFQTCLDIIERPMVLLAIFEAAGKAADAKGEYLRWTVPITNFPVVQHYTEGTVKKVWVQYGPPQGERTSTGYYINTLQLNICHTELLVPAKGEQSRGAAPNAIHSLDAAHLMLTVARSEFPVTTIHDSFGCLLADMPALFKIVRDTFVELYESNPLPTIMEAINADVSSLKVGNLAISLIRESEYCFC